MEDNKKFNTVEDYFNVQPEKVKNALILIKQFILTVVPEAKELSNYNIPAYALIEGGKREQQLLLLIS